MDLARAIVALAGFVLVTPVGCGTGTDAATGRGHGPGSGGASATCVVGDAPPFSPSPDPTATLAACVIPDGTIGALTEAPDPLPDVGNGTKPGDATDAPPSLPEDVALRTHRETFNRRYAFALDQGTVWFKSRTEVTGIQQPWAHLSIPECLDGTIIGISADDDELIAIRKDGAIYGMDNALKAPGLFNWTSHWGAPLWQGSGFQVPADLIAWAWMVICPQEDVSWTDPAGNHPAVGLGKVSHIWALRAGGQRFTFFDPWLPTDDSYEMCGPDRGRFRAANLSASGSTIAAIGKNGDIYTRFYDFDLAGDDAAFFKYSYDDQRGVNNPPIHLPIFDWVHQPKVPGRITLNLSVHKLGKNMEHRVLRVEGEDDAGVTGYWQKDIGALGTDDWQFFRTDRPLSRAVIDESADQACPAPTGPNEDLLYSRNMNLLSEIAAHAAVTSDDDWAAELVDFNVYCSPATLRIHLGPSEHFDLRLHTTDVIRQTARARGLDATLREFAGAIEVPEPLFSALGQASEKAREFVQLYLGGNRFTTVTLNGVTGVITFETPTTWVLGAP